MRGILSVLICLYPFESEVLDFQSYTSRIIGFESIDLVIFIILRFWERFLTATWTPLWERFPTATIYRHWKCLLHLRWKRHSQYYRGWKAPPTDLFLFSVGAVSNRDQSTIFLSALEVPPTFTLETLPTILSGLEGPSLPVFVYAFTGNL